jgi:hypothetical protein
MADHALKLDLDAETHARLSALAAREGLSLEAWARRRLESADSTPGVREDGSTFEPSHDWFEADRRLAEYDRTGESVDAETWLTELEAEVRARRSR